MRGRLLSISPNDPRRKETYVATQIAALERLGWEIVAAYHAKQGGGGTESDGRFVPFPVEASAAPRTALGRVEKAVATFTRRNSEQAEAGELERWCDLVESVQPDRILVQFGPVAARMLPVLRQAGVPWVVQFHGYDLTLRCGHWGYRRTLSTLLASAGAAFVPSGFLETELRQYIRPVDCAKIHLISPGYDETMFTPAMRPDRVDRRFRLVSVGRLVAVKGHDLMIDAVARAGDDIDLIIIGDGEDFEALKSRVADLGVGDRVRLAGQLPADAVQAAYKDADGFIQLSRTTSQGQREGLGLSPIEAAATGLPIIVSDSGGLGETCQHGKTGLVVPEGDVDSTVKAIRQLADDRAAASAMGAAGAEWVAATYASTRQAEKADAVLRQL